jgi:hypothetical protein
VSTLLGGSRRVVEIVMLPAPADVYDVPIYANCRVHRDHHIEIAKALYSVPGNLLGARVQPASSTNTRTAAPPSPSNAK